MVIPKELYQKSNFEEKTQQTTNSIRECRLLMILANSLQDAVGPDVNQSLLIETGGIPEQFFSQKS